MVIELAVRDAIELQDVLKRAFGTTGGEAKRRIQAGGVEVNGVVETRRARRLQPGDQVRLLDSGVVIQLVAPCG